MSTAFRTEACIKSRINNLNDSIKHVQEHISFRRDEEKEAKFYQCRKINFFFVLINVVSIHIIRY